MKNLLLLLSILFIAFGCEPESPDINIGKLDPNATILIRPAKGVKLRSEDTESLTALEIVHRTWAMIYHNDYQPGYSIKRGFADVQRDFEIPALKMWGIDIIDEDGNLKPIFIEAYDILLTTENFADTIAYIPNSVLRSAEIAIKAAYSAENYTEVYRLFNEAYTFLPITGNEWHKLQMK